jgi:hypothetical protein
VIHPYGGNHEIRTAVAAGTNGGLLYGTLQVSSNPLTHGTVTGGSGAFAGATGTITGKSISATKTAVTITYHTQPRRQGISGTRRAHLQSAAGSTR